MRRSACVAAPYSRCSTKCALRLPQAPERHSYSITRLNGGVRRDRHQHLTAAVFYTHWHTLFTIYGSALNWIASYLVSTSPSTTVRLLVTTSTASASRSSFQRRAPRRIRKNVDIDTAKSIKSAMVDARIDYCIRIYMTQQLSESRSKRNACRT